MSILTKVLRAGEGKKQKALQTLVPDINALEPEIEALSDDDLRHKTVEFRERLDGLTGAALDEALNELLIEAFAVTREAARRVIGQRHFDVQLMGGAALHFGWIAEMKTGEGKTLVSTLPAYLNGLSGRGMHIVTVNDYLARRDSEWMGRIHRWLGLSVGLVLSEIDSPDVKRQQYGCDITYGTNNEFGFDYLRDNMAMSKEQMVQRGHIYAIVDEVDSILIDEARTPLIISGQVADAAALYYKFASIVRTLQRDEDYEVDEEKRAVVPLEAGIEKVERALGVENIYAETSSNFVHHLQASLRAKELYKRDVDYVVRGGEVKIVDEFTGRILEGRRWSEGLHQAVEAKERVRIKHENQTLATITLQNYFRMYEKLAGMTGTAQTEAGEFAHTYNLPVVPIPTNRPMVRMDQADLIYKTEEGKFNAVVDDIAERYEKGQPVLVGTVSVEKSERLSRLLDKRGVQHSVLNAKHHDREAVIVSQAGRLSTVTVATNMAGRGVDIILGGNPEGLARLDTQAEGLLLDSDEGRARVEELTAQYTPECAAEGEKIRELGGLYVLGTERHESRRIDNQLRGRAGRQGDPGESRFYLSLEDDLMRLFATGLMNWVMGKTLPDDVPIEAKMVTKAIEKAQSTVEARNAERRKDVLKYDEVMNQQRKVVYRRRQDILEGADLRDEAMHTLDSTLRRVVNTFCPTQYHEDWDLPGLVHEVLNYFPTKFTAEELEEAGGPDDVHESLVQEATSYYEQREEQLGNDIMREIERRVMLSIIDQRWREHLYEMDYLQEGINLRAMGQKDPLVEWQREGFDMFGQMTEAIADDFVRYVMHLDVVVQPSTQPAVQNVQYSAATEPVQGSSAIRPAVAEAAAQSGGDGAGAPAGGAVAVDDAPVQQVVKTAEQKLGRNQPCWCGSGKKFKLCHGK
ncbi:MAG TPA: preprotein translocase subunit SecA [Acidimicrobiales bacterium]|jgi:preprotein translocase subunit SecA|nr:preprotein translocase subunit SecA [Acidimicrobiales bacterium]